MENTGWIKLHRSFLKWEWYNNVNTKMLFIHLLLKVNYEDKRWQNTDIPRGSYITSVNHLAQELNLTPRKIRTALDNLKTTKEVTIQTTKKYTRITIENWAKYQGVLLENDKANDKVIDIEMTTTKEIKNNYIYFIKKYKEQNIKGFRDKMRFLREIQNDEQYKQLSESEEYELRNIILGE